MMRWLLLISQVCFLSLVAKGQAGSDCNTALSVCNELFVETESPAGTGNVFEVAPNSCQASGEFNSAWYVFTVQENGMLNFVLQPNNNADDYDWSLFNITENGCDGVNSGESPEVSCNSWGTFGIQGPTGISSANGGAGTSNGPGDTNGPPFNQDLVVTEGQVFALVVMNFSATLDGYELDFGGSTASIFDSENPVYVSASPNCDQDEVTIVLSEYVNTEEFTVGNIQLVHNGTNYPINSIDFGGTEYANSFTVGSSTLPTFVGSVSLIFAFPPTDVCDNELPSSFNFTLNGPLQLTTETSAPCQDQAGSIVAIADGYDGNCFDFSLNNVAQSSTDCFQWSANNLPSGSFEVEVTSSDGLCTVSSNIVLTNVPVSVDAGEDRVLCDLQTNLEATFTGDNFEWLPSTGVSFSSVSQTNALASVATDGPVVLTAQAELDGCTVTDNVTLTFNFPPSIDVAITEESCFGRCDGAVEWINPNDIDITISIGSSTQTGNPIYFSQLCQGQYTAQVAFSATCLASYPFTITGYPEVIARFDADPWVTTVTTPEVSLINESVNADSVFWTIEGLDSTSMDNWNITLPAEPSNYAVQLMAFGANGCVDSTVATIIVRDEFQVYIPNSFSPNNDGLNDFFHPVFSYAPEEYELTIFNRWGEVIFFSEDFNDVWMGQKGSGDHFVQNEVYTWLLKVKGLNTETLTYKGTVLPLR